MEDLSWEESLIPAEVIYIGNGSQKFTHGRKYEAFFLEYWEGTHTSLHVRGNDGKITDFNDINEFQIVEDKDNLLNDYEATVRCISHKYDDFLLCIKYGEEYKAIGRDKDGMYFC